MIRKAFIAPVAVFLTGCVTVEQQIDPYVGSDIKRFIGDTRLPDDTIEIGESTVYVWRWDNAAGNLPRESAMKAVYDNR